MEAVSRGARSEKIKENPCFFNIFPPRTKARARRRLFRDVPEAKKPRKTNVFCYSVPLNKGSLGFFYIFVSTPILGGYWMRKNKGKPMFFSTFSLPGRGRGRDGGCFAGCPRRKNQGKPMFFLNFPSQDEGEVEMEAVSGVECSSYVWYPSTTACLLPAEPSKGKKRML